MILKRIKVQMKFVGETNCYIIVDETQKKAMVIDPAGEVPKIIEILDTLGAELVYIYLTHCHADHINGVNELKKEKGGKVLIHRKGRENLENRVPVLAEYIGLPPIYVKFILQDILMTEHLCIVKKKKCYFQETHYLKVLGEE